MLFCRINFQNFKVAFVLIIWGSGCNSGEGIPDLLLLLVQWTQKTMVEKLTYSDEMQVYCFFLLVFFNSVEAYLFMRLLILFGNLCQCTVLEVKVVEGHGTTIDVVLVNGVLHEGDQIVVCGMQASI